MEKQIALKLKNPSEQHSPRTILHNINFQTKEHTDGKIKDSKQGRNGRQSDRREGTGISQDSSQASKQSAAPKETDGKNEQMSVTDELTFFFTFRRCLLSPGRAEEDIFPQGHTC